MKNLLILFFLTFSLALTAQYSEDVTPEEAQVTLDLIDYKKANNRATEGLHLVTGGSVILVGGIAAKRGAKFNPNYDTKEWNTFANGTIALGTTTLTIGLVELIRNKVKARKIEKKYEF